MINIKEFRLGNTIQYWFTGQDRKSPLPTVKVNWQIYNNY